MAGRPRHYWAFCANPLYYRITDVVQECALDSWNIPRSDVRAGDRAIIWKAKGRDSKRGVVALADILTDPAVGLDPNRAYWVNPYGMDEPVARVTIHYRVPPSFPLWLSDGAPSVLSSLSVSRATGGSIFAVTPDQWQTLMDFVGGWPTEPPEQQEMLVAVTQATGKRRITHGYQTNPAVRRAVERYAMGRAMAHYATLGWQITDVSATQPYDLFCLRQRGEELHVEVKGTTSDGSQIVLTRNETTHAKKQYPRVALFILANIQVETQDAAPYEVSGGQAIIHEPWRISDGNLTPLTYLYTPADHE
jgi:hypothetical protein